ncbi:MAG TPA: hypothetical protein VGK32_17980 [Vicinamibacterales bacterium]|jgi:hypothetical protein
MVEMHEANGPAPGAGHETRDVSTRVVVIFATALMVGAVVVFAAIWLLFLYFGSLNDKAYPREYPMAQVGAPRQPPAPRLQTKPREEFEQMRADEEQVLHSYGWLDRTAAVVHIPIDEAMRLTLEHGLPVRAQAPADEPGGPPDRSSSGRAVGESVRK